MNSIQLLVVCIVGTVIMTFIDEGVFDGVCSAITAIMTIGFIAKHLA